MTELLHFHFSLSCIGEGNGNLLQYSCLENPRDGGAWWAAIYGVAQSQTQLQRLSSSSSKRNQYKNQSINGYWVPRLCKGWGVCIRRCVLPFQLVGGTSHIHVRKIGNLQGAGLWRMAEDRKQARLRRPRADGKIQQGE